MRKLQTTIVVLPSAILPLGGCANEQGHISGGASLLVLPSSLTQAPPTVPAPSGSSLKDCRGGKNLHWWAAHVENVTGEDLAALAALNLTARTVAPSAPPALVDQANREL